MSAARLYTAARLGLICSAISRPVVLAKVSSPALGDDPFRTFEEWHSEADAKAYADL